MKYKVKEIQHIVKVHWTVWLILILLISSTLYNAINLNREYKTITEVIELKDTNRIIDNVNILNLFCDDNVKIGKSMSNLIPFYDYVYLSTWGDGKVPHSEGKCYIKYKIRIK